MDSYSLQAVLSVKDKNFTSTMNSATSTLSGLDSSTQKSSSSVGALGTAFAVAQQVVSAACNVIKNSVSAAVERVDTLNQYPKIMEQMGFSSAEAEKSINKLSDGIQGLPTSLDSIVSSTQSIAILTGDLGSATDTALALNDAFLASGSATSDAERGLTQYTQMLSSGKVDMQSWRTLQETMGYALSETAKQLGITSGDTNKLYNALQSGQITFDQFNAAIIECDQCAGGFAETASIASEGIATSWQNVQTAVVRGVANMIQAWNDAAADNSLPTIQDSLHGLQNVCNTVFSAASTAITGFVNNLKTIVAAVAPVVTAIAGFEIAKKASEWFKQFQSSGEKAADALNNYTSKAERAEDISKKLKTAETGLKDATEKHQKATENLYQKQEQLNTANANLKTADENLKKAQDEVNDSTEDGSDASVKLEAATKEQEAAVKEATKAQEELNAARKEESETGEQVIAATDLVANAHEQEASSIEGSTVKAIAHNAVMAVLNGDMKVGEAAVKAFNAAWDANPIGMVTAAITAAISVISAVISVLKKFGVIGEGAYKEAKDFKDEVKELTESLEENRKTMEENTASAKEQSSQVDDLCSHVIELADKENKTTKDTNALRTYIDQLNDSVEGLDLAYDETTDSLNMATEAMLAQAALENRTDEYTAAQENYNQALQDYLAIGDELLEAEELQQESADASVFAKQKQKSAIEDLEAAQAEQAEVLDQALADMQDAEAEYTAAQNEACALQKQALADSVENQTLLLEDLSDANQETVEELQSTWQDYTDAATDMFDTLDTEVDVTVSDMIENMQENQRIMSEWGDNCESLRDRFASLGLDPAILDQLVDLGPEGAGYIAELVDASDAELKELSETFGNGGEVAYQSMSQSMGEGAAEVMDQAKNLITDTESTLRETVENTDWTSLGTSMTEGVGEGLESSEAANEGASEMATDARESAGTAAGEGSPATEWMPLGESMAEGVAEGLTDSAAAVDAATQMAEELRQATETALDALDFTAAGEKAFKSLADAATSGMSKVKAAVQDGMKTVESAMKSGFSSMTNTASGQMNSIASAVTSGMNSVKTAMTNGMDSVKSTMSSAFSSMTSTVTSQLNSIKSAFSGGLSDIKATVTSGLDSIKITVANGTDSIKGTVTNVINSCTTSVTNGMDKMNSAFTSGTDKAKKTASTATDSIRKTFNGLQDSLYTSGVNAMKGLQNGLNSRQSSVTSTAQSIANSVSSTINKALKVGSPSRVLKKTGRFAGEGLVIGLKDMISDVQQASGKMADAVNVTLGTFEEPTIAFAGGMEMSADYVFDVDGLRDMLDDLKVLLTDRPIELNTSLEVDGREIAHATAEYMQNEQDRIESRNRRKQMFSTGG